MITAFSAASVFGLLPVLFVGDIPGAARIALTVPVVVILGCLVWGARRCATTADLKAIRVRGIIRRHSLAWEDMQDLRIEPNPGAATQSHAPNVITCAYGRDGNRLLLPYIDDRHVDVEREVALLREIWIRLRGADWAPDPSAAVRIDRLTARRTAVMSGFAWTFLSFFPLVVLMLLPLFMDLPEALETVLAPWVVMGVGLPLIFALTALATYRRQIRAMGHRS